MLCPLALWRPVANHGGTMRSHTGLVLHVQEGTGSLFSWFDDPASQVSSHLWLAKDGTMEQYVDTDVEAWAEAAGNPDYLSVETEGFASEALTAYQIRSLAALLEWCHLVYGVAMAGPVAHGEAGFTPHCNPDGSPDPAWGNHTCPGRWRLGQMAQIVALANGTPNVPGGSTEMDSVVAPNGDIISHYRTPDNHLLEVTRRAGHQGEAATSELEIIDITAQYPQFLVVS